MTIFFMEWNSFGNEDIMEAFEEKGHRVHRIPFTNDALIQDELMELFGTELKRDCCDFVFSFNYYPEISKACMEMKLKYVSWVYDSPHIQVYSYTAINDCNYIFLFDHATYQELHNAGIPTVYYLPLAVNSDRMSRIDRNCPAGNKYISDVTFIGSLYSEKKHRLYDRFSTLPDYEKGYLDGLIMAQKNVQGYNFLQELLTDGVLQEMQKVYPTNPEAETVLSSEAIYADYVLARQVTALERRECLEKLGNIARTKLYTYDKTTSIGNVVNCGPCDYYESMPEIIRTSKVNLNITLRSIKTGIPLRALDIMSNGGFLITNYQEEMFWYLEPEKDFVFYSDIEELVDKAKYYLKHDNERERIALQGCERVRKEFSYRTQLVKMLEIVGGGKR